MFMTIPIKNASPEFIPLGTDDKGSRPVLPTTPSYPQHLPYFIIQAEQGSTEATLVVPGTELALYGKETFNKKGVFYNHQTKLLMKTLDKGNVCMVERVVMADATQPSNVALYMDIHETDVPNYLRNSDGSIVLNPTTGVKEVDGITPAIPGFRVKFITDTTAGTGTLDLAGLPILPGTMGAGADRSNMYPIMAFKAPEKGKRYDHYGIRIGDLVGDDANPTAIEQMKAYPLTIGIEELTSNGPINLKTLFGAPFANFTFLEGGTDPATTANMDLRDVFNDSFFNTTDQLLTLRPPTIEDIHVYRDNISTILDRLIALEAPYITDVETTWVDGGIASTRSWMDFTTTDTAEIIANEKHILNIIGMRSSARVPYFTIQQDDGVANLVEEQREVSLSNDNVFYMRSGDEGTVSVSNYEDQVSLIMLEYLDPDSRRMDTAVNNESVLYDTGFSLETKKDLVAFITLRKDTVLGLGTHDAALGDNSYSLTQTRAVAVALRTRLRMAPESVYYGTGVARAIIACGDGKERGPDRTRSGLINSIAEKTAKLAGASNGKWKRDKMFDHGPNANITELIDIQPKFIPAGVKPLLWNGGLIWPEPKDTQTHYLPAMQTVYDDDTSPLNSWWAALAICTCTKAADKIRRSFSGSSFLPNDEFITAVTNKLSFEVNATHFADYIKVVPEVIILPDDEQRGFTYRVKYKIYSGVMKTKMIYTTEVYRIGDL